MAKRLVDYADKQLEGKPLRLDDIAGQEVTVKGAAFGHGDYGDYALIDVVNEEGELLTVQTSAFLVLDALTHALENEGFPLVATFRKRGRPWIIE